MKIITLHTLGAASVKELNAHMHAKLEKKN